MRSAVVTNRVTLPAQSHSATDRGITVNAAIPVASVAPWKLEAIDKVVSFGRLSQNWDAEGSGAPGMLVRQTAIELLLRIPVESIAPPRVVPMWGGGLHFEWSVGDREIEISIDSDCKIEALQVEGGMPREDDPGQLMELFDWLLAV